MVDKKQRFFRLIEYYINEFNKDAVQEMYGKGSKIKMHSINFGVTKTVVLLEAVIVLGDTINEQFIDRQLADILIQDAIGYFFPEYSVKTYVRFDV
jgi:hypothetical protein